MLPRIPVPTQRLFKVSLLQASQNHSRQLRNMESNLHLLYPGAQIRALYEDEENPLTWYEAVVEAEEIRVNEWDVRKYTVTFPEYGNREIVAIGEIEVGAGTVEELPLATMDDVMAREREASSTGSKQKGSVRGLMQSMATGATGSKRQRDVTDEVSDKKKKRKKKKKKMNDEKAHSMYTLLVKGGGREENKQEPISVS